MPKSQLFFVVAELNNVILEFTDVSAVTEGRGPCICCPCEPLPPPRKPWSWHGNMGVQRPGSEGVSHSYPKGSACRKVKGQLAERPSKERRVGNYFTAHSLSTKKSHMGWHFKNGLWSFGPLVKSLCFRTLRWTWHPVVLSLLQARGTATESHALLKSNFLSWIAKYSEIKKTHIYLKTNFIPEFWRFQC